MAHESFEDTEVAEVLNAGFVAVKVDREERPDVDAVYMEAVQLVTGAGGWPMTVWRLADGRPFWAGTYLPKAVSSACSAGVRELWATKRADLEHDAARLADAVRQADCRPLSGSVPGRRPGAEPPGWPAARPSERGEPSRWPGAGAGRPRGRERCLRPLRPAMGRLRRRAQVPPADHPRGPGAELVALRRRRRRSTPCAARSTP